ncbi:MAG: hypothetical protein AAF387_20555 [Pseudomonadota bacterium]
MKRNPQDVPHSAFLLHLLITCNVVINFIINVANAPVQAAAILSVLVVILVYAFISLLLWCLKRTSRTQQTLVALFGTDLVIGGPAIVLRYWLQWLNANNLQSDIAVLLWMCLYVWNLIVIAHILRHAFGKSFGVGVAASIAYTIVLFNVMYLAHDLLVGPV